MQVSRIDFENVTALDGRAYVRVSVIAEDGTCSDSWDYPFAESLQAELDAWRLAEWHNVNMRRLGAMQRGRRFA